MHFNLDRALRIVIRSVAILLVISLLFILTSTVFIGWSEFSSMRHLKQLRSESQIPKELTNLGLHSLTSIFAANEDQICVFHSCTGIREVPEMSPVQKQATKHLELPSEELTWYLIAFQGDRITRVLLVDESIDAKLTSKSRCFRPESSGLISVQEYSSESSSIPKVEFVVKE